MTEQEIPREVQALQLSLRQAKALLAAQTELRQAAEAQATAARAELERMATALCPAQVNELAQRNPDGLNALRARQIADMVILAVRRELGQLQAAAMMVQGAGAQAPESATVEEHRARFIPDDPEPFPSGDEPPRPRDALPPWRDVRLYDPPDEPEVPVDSWPEWARAWRDEDPSFQRSADAVLILGDTGLARRQDVVGLIASRWQVTPGSGSIGRGLKRVSELGLVEPIPVQREKGWKPGHMLRLTERGRDAYRLLCGQDPQPSQATLLLNRHKSAEHAMLNLEVAELLWAAGYEVELFPDDVLLDDGTYRPDLVAQLGERTLYIECERATAKNAAERARKWDLTYRATGGHLAIVTPSEATTREIGREVLAWAGERPLTLWMTDLERVRGNGEDSAFRLAGERVWLVRQAQGRS